MQRHLPILALLACLALAVAVYFPGVRGSLLFDDTLNLVENTRLHIQSLDMEGLKVAAWSGDAGMLGRPVALLSFALNHYFSGLDPYYFKLTNIAIHLLNGLCIYTLTILLIGVHHRRTGDQLPTSTVRWIATATTAAWILHPLNLTAVLYVVQRMTSLASLFTFLGLISYVVGRRNIIERRTGWTWIAASFLLFLPLAAFSKENGALLPMFLLLAEITFFRFDAPSKRSRHQLVGLFTLTVALPLAAALIYVALHPSWLTVGYLIRDFTPAERLMTEARILWHYLYWIAIPDISQLGIYHDDIPISTGAFAPPTTFFACIGIMLFAALGVACLRRLPIVGFGILFFLLGHGMESTILPLELVHEHRNYLPLYGPVFIAAYYLLCPAIHRSTLRVRRMAFIAFVAMAAGVTFLRSTQWSDPQTMLEMEVLHHPRSIRANIDMAGAYASMPAQNPIEADIYYRQAYDHYVEAAELSDKDTLGLFGLIALDSRHKIAVENAWIVALAKRLEKYPFTASSANALMGLEKCVAAAVCHLSPDAMETLLQAAQRNPTLHSKSKAAVLFAWSDFLLTHRRDRDAAAVAARNAAGIAPNDPEQQTTLVRFLIRMGKLDEARTLIQQLRANRAMSSQAAILTTLEQDAATTAHTAH